MRTPEDQARIMLKNIEIYGKEHQNKLYAKSGRIIIAIAPDKDSLKKMNQIEKNEIIKKMVAKINELGPATVSKHCGDPSVINVIDIAPTSLKNKKAFEQAIENSTKISKYFFPTKDPAYHIEIKQPLNK